MLITKWGKLQGLTALLELKLAINPLKCQLHSQIYFNNLASGSATSPGLILIRSVRPTFHLSSGHPTWRPSSAANPQLSPASSPFQIPYIFVYVNNYPGNQERNIDSSSPSLYIQFNNQLSCFYFLILTIHYLFPLPISSLLQIFITGFLTGFSALISNILYFTHLSAK